ncbi:MAG: hypothetical protein SFV32_12935 [Opitutaceae bacterium]|nr:hypothetical protein [Opitutaceae bacterium]
MRINSLAAVTIFGALGVSLASAQNENDSKTRRFAVAGEAGTLGYGASVVYTINASLTASVGYNFFDYSASDIEVDDTTFDGDLELSNIPVLLHWHPFKGTFNVFGGGVIADNSVAVRGRLTNGTIEIGDVVYTAAQIGELHGRAKVAQDFSPMLGLGWSKSPLATGWGAYVQLGAMFGGSPNSSLSVTGPIKDDPGFKSELAKEQKSLDDELDDYNIFPIVRAGVIYRF